MGTYTREEIRARVADLGQWFHDLDLNGVRTAPEHFLHDYPAVKWRRFAHAIPADLSGRTVLDIGCNAGFYSFELARRGARVTGIDYDPRYLRQARWAARRFGVEDRVEFRRMQVYDLARGVGGDERWDLVLFMGVLYHLRYPLLGLDIVARRVRRLMVFQTLTMPGEEVYDAPPDLPIDERDTLLDAGWPKMAFLEHRLAADPTNWWAPNHAAVEAMLRSAGLQVTGRPGHEIYLCEPGEPREELGWIEEEMLAATGIRPIAPRHGS